MSRESDRNSASNKHRAITEALKVIKKQFGDGSIMRLNGEDIAQVEVIPTGSLSIDLALGVGGLPRGRIVEVYGPESSGKTTLTLHAIAEAQSRGGVCAFIDAEHALDTDYARRLGVKLDDLLVSQPDCGEQALEIADTLVRTGANQSDEVLPAPDAASASLPMSSTSSATSRENRRASCSSRPLASW